MSHKEGGDRGVCGTGWVPVPGTMVVEPFGTTCEEVIGAERREKLFSGGTKFSKVVPFLGASVGMLPPKNF